MKKRFLFLGTVLIVGNVAFAVTLERPQEQNKQLSQLKCSDAHSRLGALLEAKGLEKEAAIQKAAVLTDGSAMRFDAQLQTLFATHTHLDASKTYDYLARQALFGKKVDLASYDALVRMVHAIEGKHPEPATRATLKQIARLNAMAA